MFVILTLVTHVSFIPGYTSRATKSSESAARTVETILAAIVGTVLSKVEIIARCN